MNECKRNIIEKLVVSYAKNTKEGVPGKLVSEHKYFLLLLL